MDTKTRSEMIQRLQANPEAAAGIWLHGLKGGIGAITSAALVMQEILAMQGDEADPALVEMIEVILGRADYVLGMIDIFRETDLLRPAPPET